MKRGRRIVALAWVALAVLVSAQRLAAEEVWVAPTHYVTAGLNAFPWSTTGSGFASFGFAVPNDFASLVSVKVVLVPKANVSGSYDVYGSVKRNAEVAGAGLLFNLAIPATLTVGTVQEVDITGLLAGDIGASSAGTDYVSVFFYFPASPGLEDATVLGLRFVYDPLPVANLADGSVTGPKLASNSVDSSKVVNGSLTGGDIADGSVTGADIADGTIAAADVNSAQVQLRVTQGCVVGESIRTIGIGGTVTCETDTVGMTNYLRRTFAAGPCPANTLCGLTIVCLAGRTVMGGGVQLDETVNFATFTNFHLVDSFPAADDSWTVHVHNANAFDVDVVAYATCSAQATGSGSTARPEPVRPEIREVFPGPRR